MVQIGPLTKTGPSVSFYTDGYVLEQDWANNRSKIEVVIHCYGGPNSLWNQSHYEGWGDHYGGFDGVGVVVRHYVTSGFLPYGYNAGDQRWAYYGQVWVNHDSAGNLSLTLRMHTAYDVHDEDHTATLNVARIPQLPQAPSNLYLEPGTVTTTSFGVRYTRGDNMGAAIDYDHAQWATDVNFTNVVWNDTPPNGTPNGYSNPSGVTPPVPLAPGTTHYVRVRSHNTRGWSPWSPTFSHTTLPAVAPGFTIAPQPSGEKAKLTFSPPGGVSGVNRYEWERRLNGTTTPVSDGDTTATTTTIGGLAPGSVYDWRASAVIGTYQSPWTNWIPATQPRPNTTPGDYFDGSSGGADLTYAWTGTPGNSSSTATAPVPEGWAATVPGGTVVVAQATAGLFGFKAARVTVMTDATGPGGRFGQRGAAPFAAAVTDGASYMGSIYARLDRSQRVAAEITWLDGAHALISRVAGESSLVPAGAWTRLWAAGPAPDNAEFAYVSLVDLVGTGHAPWQGGDVVDLDGAMITIGDLFPYFDGDTPDTSEYRYDWEADPNASESTRTQLAAGVVVVGSGSLVDPDCPPVPPPPRPPLIPTACIEETGVWRRFYAAISASEVSDWLDVVPTIEIVTQTQVVRQVRLRIYENPDNLLTNEVNTDVWASEQIVSFVPAHTVLTLDGVTQRVWAEVAGRAPQAADHLLYGSGGTPATWPILSCGIAYLISVDLPVEISQGDSKIYAYLTTRS